MPLARGPVLLGVLAVMLGLGLGLAQPRVLSLLHRTAPPGGTAEAVGVRIVLMNASQAVLPVCAGVAGLSLGVGRSSGGCSGSNSPTFAAPRPEFSGYPRGLVTTRRPSTS